MAGRRLLDVARIVQATRSIAKKHVALRSQQYDIYSKTTTLARAAKEQTDRVTLTVQAAIAIAQRLGESDARHEADTGATDHQPQPSTRDSKSEPKAEEVQNSMSSKVEQSQII